ncbi:hypothetical protein EK21DRAFT_94299 [Setomelanomma holmii]|uniref:Uncharacterized protein n=1 Tax=Setomelanomma holmii TaxID=210430 RepID=A0A9P4GZ99_9PLEO|nr:hypothetical protein EK21DRAFT_94299 [Setomelanomma holmii]
MSTSPVLLTSGDWTPTNTSMASFSRTTDQYELTAPHQANVGRLAGTIVPELLSLAGDAADIRHSIRNTILIMHHAANGFYITYGTKRWLEEIGSQASMVRKVVIDLDCLCPADCMIAWPGFGKHHHLSLEMFDVKPVLGYMWRYELSLDISLTQDGGRRYQENIAEHPTILPPAAYGYDVASITQTFRSLMQEQLRVREYGSLLHSVGIERDSAMGALQWATTNKSGCPDYNTPKDTCGCTQQLKIFAPYTNTFSILEGGDLLRLQDREMSMRFFSLPDSIHEKVVDFIVKQNRPIEIDVNTQRGFDPSLAQVDRSIFWENWDRFIKHNRFILRYTVRDGSSNLSDLGSLRRLLRKDFKAPLWEASGFCAWPFPLLLEDAVAIRVVSVFASRGAV